jgi:hypothetical protein
MAVASADGATQLYRRLGNSVFLASNSSAKRTP